MIVLRSSGSGPAKTREDAMGRVFEDTFLDARGDLFVGITDNAYPGWR
jgi:hypothetical protein